MPKFLWLVICLSFFAQAEIRKVSTLRVFSAQLWWCLRAMYGGLTVSVIIT